VTYKSRPTLDKLGRGLSFVAVGTPSFWLALIGLIFGFQHFHLFPGPEGRLSSSYNPPHSITGLYTVDSLLHGQFGEFVDALWHLLLPGLVLAFAAFGFMFRLLRTNLLEVRNEPFLIVVRSKGVPRWTAFVRHALPNAFLPTLTASALILADLLAGSVLVETVFVWPGVGQLVVNSIQRQDVGINTLVDLIYGVIDPRVRLRPQAA
jgi:ABC-type dipeptide/oligopeptide/nickel transport system permease component